MSIQVQEPTLSDAEQGIILGRVMHAESVYKKLPYDDVKIRKLVAGALASDDCFVRVAYDGTQKKIIGFMLGYVSEYFFCTDKIAQDMALFVEPNARGQSAGLQLIKAFEEWAKTKKVKEVCFGITTGVDIPRTAQLYLIMGYQIVGLVHKKEF